MVGKYLFCHTTWSPGGVTNLNKGYCYKIEQEIDLFGTRRYLIKNDVGIFTPVSCDRLFRDTDRHLCFPKKEVLTKKIKLKKLNVK